MTKHRTNPETLELLRGHDSFLIVNHRRPDGDAVGSAAALCRSLRGAGKQAWIWKNPETTERYLPYLAGLETEEVPEGAVLISVDMATENLLPLNAGHLAGRFLLCLDHHGSNDGYAANTNVRPDCAACGELLLELLPELSPVTREIAEALYLAISTDTGCFQYSNVTGNTLRAAAALKDLGADTFSINKVMFGTKSIARLRLEAALTDSVEFYAGGKVAVCSISRAMMEELGATEDDLDDISGFPRDIQGVAIGVLVKELREGGAKVSLRTDGDYDASAICKRMGGGGHKAAAGAQDDGGMDSCKARILQAIAESGVDLR